MDNDFQLACDNLNIENLTKITLSTPKIDFPQICKNDITLNQMKRSLEELVSFVYRECSFPKGCLIMTGTGIVPGSDFTLHSNDEIKISIDPIGTLVNTVR